MQHTQGTSSNSRKNLAALTEFFNSLIVYPGHDAESKFKEFIAIEFTSDGQHKYKLIDYFNNAALRKEIWYRNLGKVSRDFNSTRLYRISW